MPGTFVLRPFFFDMLCSVLVYGALPNIECGTLPHEGEDIRVFTLPLTEAYGMVKDGRINNSMAVISIQWLMLEKATLKARWGM